MKKLLTAVYALFMLIAFSAFAEEGMYILENEAGGVIARGTAAYRTRALISELNLAYLETDAPYLTKGVQTAFTVYATGGDGIYSYSFNMYRRSGTSGAFYYVASQNSTRSNKYFFTPTENSGQYLLVVTIADSAGSYIEWQSQVFESSSHASVAKARSITEQCRAQADSDYARALWLHDWLIYNAEYDYSYQYFFPEGVLLYGKGVCQSYALAYDMMLKMVGIECLYITGYAGGDAHGWNLVNIGGSWYHVDCTWDDPGNGMENHDYFCVSDEVMMRDHEWHNETPIMPSCTDNNYMYALRAGADVCLTQEDVVSILNKSLENGTGYTEIWYAGSAASFDFASAIAAWEDQAQFPFGFASYQYLLSGISLKMEYDFGGGYPDLSVPVKLTLDPARTDMNTAQTMKMLVLSLPSVADKTGLVWSSSNENSIRVEDGVLTAVAPGTAVITAAHPGGAQGKITMYVNSNCELIIPSGIVRIEDAAFSGCSLLERVTLQTGTQSIGEKAFSDCALLKYVTIPESVTYIAPDAFSGCERLTILCPDGSYACRYAADNGIEFERMSTEP